MPYVTETTITDIVLKRWSAVPDPRLRQIMQSMITHLHAFVREIEPTEGEWEAAIEWLTRTGRQSNDKRQEFILASDVVGVSMLVDCINHRLSGDATPTTMTGPFHVHDSPNLADGGNIANGAPGEPCYIVGSVGRGDEPYRDQPDAAVAYSFPDRSERSSPIGHASVQEILSVYRDRRGLWRQGAADRRIQVDASGQHDADRSDRQSGVLAARV